MFFVEEDSDLSDAKRPDYAALSLSLSLVQISVFSNHGSSKFNDPLDSSHRREIHEKNRKENPHKIE